MVHPATLEKRQAIFYSCTPIVCTTQQFYSRCLPKKNAMSTKDLYTDVHSSSIHIPQKLETIQISFNWLANEMLLSDQRGPATAIYMQWVNDSQNTLCWLKEARHKRLRKVWFHLYVPWRKKQNYGDRNQLSGREQMQGRGGEGIDYKGALGNFLEWWKCSLPGTVVVVTRL